VHDAIEELGELIERLALNSEMGAVGEMLAREGITMSLSKKERDLLTRQLFDAIAEVGFCTWQAQQPEDFRDLLKHNTLPQLREHYREGFEKTAWNELQEMARGWPDEQLVGRLTEWRMRSMQRDAGRLPTVRGRDIDLDR
jgi:hypothetical protein